MAIFWKPNGSLNVARDAADLPGAFSDAGEISEAFARSRNLRMERGGLVDTRLGSERTTSVGLSGTVWHATEMDGKRYSFVGPGIYRDEVLIQGGVQSREWASIQYNQFSDTSEQIFALNGQDRRRISGTSVNEWGIEAPTVAPSAASGGAGGLTGDYKARYTYARLQGSTVVSESNPSPVSATASLSSNTLSVTWTASTDPQVTHVLLYRTFTGGDTYYHLVTTPIGTVNSNLGTGDASLGALVETDHDRPPKGTLVAGPFFNGVCFIAKSNLLYYCLSQRPEYWPTTSYVEVGAPQFPIKAIVEARGQVYAFSRNGMWLIQGGGGGSFQPVPIASLAGATNQYAALSVDGHGIFHVGLDGVYLYSGGKDRKLTQDAFDPIFPKGGESGEITNGMARATVDDMRNAWLAQYGNRVFFHYGAGSALVINLDSGRTTHYQYDNALRAPFIDEKNGRLYCGDAAGYIRQLEKGTTDPSGAIAWEAQTKDYTLQTRRHFPRWVKYDTTGTMTGKLILDGEVHQEHAITRSRHPKRRLVKTGNGLRMAVRLSGTGSATIYAVEAE